MDQTSSFSAFTKRKAFHFKERVNNALGMNSNSILVLDGLRAIACVSVLYFHFRWLSSGYISQFPTKGPLAYVTAFFVFGNAGVILFFLLSGFLLFLPFAKALLFEESTWPSLRRFYLRRLFRIIPAYYLSLVLLVLFIHPEFLHLNQWHAIVRFLTFSMNYGLALKLNGVFWTLAIEFQFYMLLPLIAWAMSLFVRRGSLPRRFTRLVLCLLAMIGWGLATRYWALYLVDTTQLDWLLPHSVGVALRFLIYGDPGYVESGKYFEVFGLGMLLCAYYVYSRNRPQNAQEKRSNQFFSVILGLIGLSGLALLTVWNGYSIFRANHFDTGTTLHYLASAYGKWETPWLIGRPFVIGLSYACCMFALLHGPTWLKKPLEWSPLRWLGAISYSLYIWHMPLAYMFLDYSLPKFTTWGITVRSTILILWLVIIILPFSAIIYRYVERPGIRLGEALLRRIERPEIRLAAQGIATEPPGTQESAPPLTGSDRNADDEATEKLVALR